MLAGKPAEECGARPAARLESGIRYLALQPPVSPGRLIFTLGRLLSKRRWDWPPDTCRRSSVGRLRYSVSIRHSVCTIVNTIDRKFPGQRSARRGAR
jgi:hypothetical protein